MMCLCRRLWRLTTEPTLLVGTDGTPHDGRTVGQRIGRSQRSGLVTSHAETPQRSRGDCDSSTLFDLSTESVSE